MPRSSFHTSRTNAPLAAAAVCGLGWLLAAAPWACAKHNVDAATPVASLAETKDAQSAFQTIRAKWFFATPAERIALAPQLQAFRERYPGDPLARVADAYLAFIALEQGRLQDAEAIAASVGQGPAGNTRDLATLVRGATLVSANEPERALRALEPLEGKLLDTFAADLFYEAIVEAALRAHRWLPAARYMNAWIRESDETDRRAIRKRIDINLLRVPPAALESVLNVIRRDPRVDAWDKEMRAAVALRLGQVAVERADASLARRVIETSRSVEGLADAGSELEELASLGARVPTVSGRIVGLVAPTAQARLRRRATDAIQGVLDVIAPRATAETTSLPIVRMHETGAELEDVITSLDALAQDGAAMAIAGFDPEGASAAAGWAEAESMPVVLLVRPSRMPEGARFVFVLGESESSLEASVVSAAQQAAQGKVGRVLPPASAKADDVAPCDAASPSAGLPRFPFAAWHADKVGAIAVAGGVTCASDVLSELHAMRWQPTVVLGLPALGARPAPRYGGVVLQALAGRLGEVRGTPLDDSSLARWRGRYGASPGWFAALGHDAAALAVQAVSVLPASDTADQHEVSQRRAQVQQALLRATAILWTTSSAGFDGAREVKRNIRYERVGTR